MSPPQPPKELYPHVVDVSAQRVAKVYAEALLNAAEKQNQTVAVLEELEALRRELLDANPLISAFITTSAIGRRVKESVLAHTFHGRVSELVFNFLMVLNRHERLDLLRSIVESYRQIHDERARRIRILVRTAVPLQLDQRQRLLQGLQEYFQLQPIMEERVEPDLLGGMILRVGDWVFDTSVRTSLETIRNRLLAESSHEIQSRRDRFCSAS